MRKLDEGQSRSMPSMTGGKFMEAIGEREGRKKPFLIGVTGGTASGKTTVCQNIMSELRKRGSATRMAIVSQDSFYRPLTEEHRAEAFKQNYNFDHPNAFDFECLREVLQKLKEGRSVEIPKYDFKTHSRLPDTTTIVGADVVLVEGILLLADPETCKMFDMRVFVDVDADTRLARRVVRDITERGRDLHGVLQQYERFVKWAFDEFILPSKRYADIIIPRGADNLVAIELLVQHIHSKLNENP